MNSFSSVLPVLYKNSIPVVFGEIRNIDATETDPLLHYSSHKSSDHKHQKTMDANILLRPKNPRKILVDIFAIFFGIGAWIGVNSIFNEVPLLIQNAPEKWNLPSYLTVIIQIANIGPITYGILKKHWHINDRYYIYVILGIATLSALLMAFCYQITSTILGTEHSTALLILMFFTALVGCTSSVLFMPYMGRFLEKYMITYMIGEGLSGFLSSIVAIIQGVGKTTCTNTTINGSIVVTAETEPARFSTQIYFFIECAILIISFVSFFLLNNLSVCHTQLVEKVNSGKQRIQTDASEWDTELSRSAQSNISSFSTKTIRFLCYYMAIINLFGNGVFPSIQSYSAMPFGQNTYHFTVTLSNMANPLACFLAYFLPRTSRIGLSGLTVFLTLIGAYLFAEALMSPSPYLVGTVMGSSITVIGWVLFTGLLSYAKLSVTLMIRKEFTGNDSTLFWCGAFSQIGSALGAIIIFFAINCTDIFKQYDYCSNQSTV